MSDYLCVSELLENFSIQGCSDLIPPENGALACDVWVGGRYCHPLCSQGYSVLASLPNFLICQANGIWTQHDRLKDCFSKYGLPEGKI